MPPKAKESVRCYIWLRLLLYWDDVRQHLNNEIIKKVANLGRLKEEIELEEKLLRLNLAEMEAGNSVTDIFEKVTEVKRVGVTVKSVQFRPTHNQQQVEILNDVILRSAGVDIFDEKTLVKHLKELSGNGNDNCKLNQNKSSDDNYSDLETTQQIEIEFVEQESNTLKKADLDATARYFISKVKRLDPKMRNSYVNILQFMNVFGDGNCEDSDAQSSTLNKDEDNIVQKPTEIEPHKDTVNMNGMIVENSLENEYIPLPKDIAKIFNDNLVEENGIKWIRLGPNGTKLPERELREIDWTRSGPFVTRQLLMRFFQFETTAANSLSPEPTPPLVAKSTYQRLKLSDSVIDDLMDFTKLTKDFRLTDSLIETSKKKCNKSCVKGRGRRGKR